MDQYDWDLVILRSCLAKWGLRPDSDLAPDIETIAYGEGTTAEKVDRLGDELANNIRAGRQPA